MPVLAIPKLIATLISLAILAGGVYLLWSWNQGELIVFDDGAVRRVHGPPWRLWTGCALLAWSFLGRFVVLALLPAKADAPHNERGEAASVIAPDGSMLRLDSFGSADAPALVLTHGWGLTGMAWSRTIRALSDRFRVVTWDLPGLGRSERPMDGRFTLDGFARALGAVVEASGERRVVLVGHSIGGMTTETFWRACPAALRRRVAGVVLVDTTYVDPLKTMLGKGLWTALQKPVIEPLNALAVFLSPLLWLSAWQSYLSGSSHIAMRLTGFGRHAGRDEVDFAARLACKGSPAVQAKGNLAMMRWSAEDILAQLDVPVLIITGEDDIVTLPEASETMAREIPDARLIRVEGAGHMGFMERAEVYNAAIADFAEAAFQRPEEARRRPDTAQAVAGGGAEERPSLH